MIKDRLKELQATDVDYVDAKLVFWFERATLLTTCIHTTYGYNFKCAQSLRSGAAKMYAIRPFFFLNSPQATDNSYILSKAKNVPDGFSDLTIMFAYFLLSIEKCINLIVEDVFPNHVSRINSRSNMSGVDNVALDIHVSDSYGYMEHFFDQIVQCRLKIRHIKEHVVLMRTLHGKLLNLPRQDENMKKDIDLKTGHVKKMGKQVSTTLKGLEKQINQEEDESSNDNEQVSAALRIRKTQHTTTVHMLVEALAEFNAEQIDYKEKCEERMQRVISIAKAEISNDQFDELVSQGNYSAVFNGNIIAETLEARKTLQEVQDRHMELMKLEKSIQELREMFVEMALLVEKQGDIVNSIEQHVMRAGEAAENAKIETKKAVVYNSKVRTKKIIFMMICVCVILCVLAWLYSNFFGSDDTTE